MIQKGCDGKVMVSAKKVGQIDSWNLNIDITTADTTALGDLWEDCEAVKKAWNGSMSAIFDNKSHKALIDNILGGNIKLDVELFAGKEVSFSGKIQCTNAAVNATQGDKTSLSINFKGCGALSSTGMEEETA